MYNNSGEYVAHNDFKVGEETQEDSFKLLSGDTYTFVSYSIGSASDLPELKDNKNQVDISVAELHEISANYLMYQKQKVTIVGGRDNYIDITMNHQFSEITTVIRHKYEAGRIEEVSGAKFSPIRENASLAFQNNALSYSSKTKEVSVSFGEISGNTHSTTSKPVSLISENTESAKFTIEKLTINGLSNPLIYEDLKITPGMRYNLILEVNARCIADTDRRTLNLNESSNVETFTLPEADFGFVFDIQELDNSFDMEINGVHLLSAQRQKQRCIAGGGGTTYRDTQMEPYSFIDVNFENSEADNIARNIRFKDGSQYGNILLGYRTEIVNGKPKEVPVNNEIWNIIGTTENPALRIIIEKDRTVKYFGSKVPEGPLFPLEIITSEIEHKTNEKCALIFKKQRVVYSENKVTWHNNRPNIVKISQAKIGDTLLKGSGSGQKKVSCADL